MIHLAIVGTGGMGNVHARAFAGKRGIRITAVADSDPAKARAFADKYDIPRVFTDIDELLSFDSIDAICNVTPDVVHAPVTMAALAAGKHVLCEKPLATNVPDARAMAAAARKAGTINMVNFSYRRSAALQRAQKMIQRGDLGRIMHFESSYLQSWLSAKYWGDWRREPRFLWRLSTGHQSAGVLGDVGVHIFDFATYPTGSISQLYCRLKTFPKSTGERIGEYVLDANDSAMATVETEDGALGTIHTTRWATGHKNSLRLRIFGEEGALSIDLDRSWNDLDVCTGKRINTAEWKTIRCAPHPDIYETFARCIRRGEQAQPDFNRGAEVQCMLDACFRSNAEGRAVALDY